MRFIEMQTEHRLRVTALDISFLQWRYCIFFDRLCFHNFATKCFQEQTGKSKKGHNLSRQNSNRGGIQCIYIPLASNVALIQGPFLFHHCSNFAIKDRVFYYFLLVSS